MKPSADANNLAFGDCLDALNIETIFQLLTHGYLSWQTIANILDDLRIAVQREED